MRDILFVGNILASVTHEMQNVMAIIKESGALTDDILQLNGPPRMRHADKLQAALRNIQEQVGRGRDLMLMLNGFAHAAADYPVTGDLSRFTRQISVLAERMVRLKECTLEQDVAGTPIPVHGNALMLMQTVYLGLAAVLDGCSPHDKILLAILPPDCETFAPSMAAVRISAVPGRATPATEGLAPVLAELGGHCLAEQGALRLYYRSVGREAAV